VKIQCSHSKLADVDALVENPRNPNKHPKRQIELLAKILKHQGWRNPIVVSKRSGFIVSGHGRLEAARLNGWTQVPIDEQDFENEAAEFAHLIADNKIAELAEHDDSLMLEGIQDLDIKDFELLGLDNLTLEELKEITEGDDVYTRKVESPVYEIKGEKPRISDLFNTEKTDHLLEEIDKSDVSAELKHFLTLAAHRHTKFNYKNIAEFYAHLSKEEQILFENSALVVIDFDKAIELGFVKMTEQVADLIKEEKNHADEE